MNKNIIEELVLEQKKSSLKNHFFDALFVNTLKYSGEIRSKEILLWRSSSWLRGAYPVFHIKFNSNDQFSGISIEKNPYHTIFGKITLILLIIFMSFPIIGRGFQEGWKASLIIPLLFVIPFLILRKLEIMEKRNLIEELKETLEDLERKYYPERFKNTPKKKKEKGKRKSMDN
ncbi:hypothetical protein E7Z59_07080 [Robertkochia marina]|uniref:Uncharacterized protein n=1 Tax=Robertkochia marina TaxID=1227945 RepID=A0A4S3LZT2_9FLAO|nr:hypothetical protein [Robertkochia marina]THD67418.1 hypothetical protein E7Z59_07080 [Robertkochia marina]TRZ40795.1 hypothetical protein D3A96_15265 [Robertkochia marina]